MKYILILLLIIISVGCQNENNGVEKMSSDNGKIKIKLNENIKIWDLEIYFDKYVEVQELDRDGNPGLLVVYTLTLKKEGESKKIDFAFHPELENPVETWRGYQVSFLDGSSYEIELKIEKELKN